MPILQIIKTTRIFICKVLKNMLILRCDSETNHIHTLKYSLKSFKSIFYYRVEFFNSFNDSHYLLSPTVDFKSSVKASKALVNGYGLSANEFKISNFFNV